METTSTVVPYFLYASGILLREGLEALLVIIALVASTREAGQEARARDVYAGGTIAIFVSIALAWVVNHLIGDNTSDTLEGIFQLTAAATLFYVSSWLTSKSQARQWNSFIQSQMDAAKRSKGPSIALGLTAFLAVMREGAETIVFFQALVAGATEQAERHAVMLGVIAGAIVLALVFIGLRGLVSRIPIGAFFSVTSVLLYAMAVIFVGQGIASFQESGLMKATFIDHLPTLPMIGFFPTIQTIVAQAILILLAAAAALVPLARKPQAPAAVAPVRSNRPQGPHPHTT
jgi:high-affinity iron transporter